jgi:hypothetical protein
MAIYARNPVLPTSPVMTPPHVIAQQPGVPRLTAGGGGFPLDPSGLVPVNRAQPTFTTPTALATNRIAAMPPSSFSGAGAAFIPVDRPSAPVATPAVMQTDQGPTVVQTAPPATATGDAATALGMQTIYNNLDPQQMDIYHSAVSSLPADQRAHMYGPNGRQEMMDRLQRLLPPDVFARLQTRLAANWDWRNRQQQPPPAVPVPPVPPSRADWIRAHMATQLPAVPPVTMPDGRGLLGINGG